MTPDEVRDRLAELRGWVWEPGVEGDPIWYKRGTEWDRITGFPIEYQYDHPIPNTIDEAEKLPEGCRGCETIHVGLSNTVAVIVAGPLTGTRAEGPTELEARFRLRLACELAEKEKQ